MYAWAIVCGLCLGVGLWAVVSIIPSLARRRLAHRIAPYLGDVSPSARVMLDRRNVSPLPVFGTILDPGLARIRKLAVPLFGSSAVLETRLRQSGASITVAAFRSRQLVWILCGVASGVVFSVLLGHATGSGIAVQLAVVLLFGIGGAVASDQRLTRAAAARLKRMTAELPVVLEFLTLSLSAGEGVLDSFRRIASTSRGELAQELGGVVALVNSGSALAESLHSVARGLSMPEFTRCVDQIVGALERGTPLVEVLRAQSQDVREESKRNLLEVAGRKEVAMMIPLVFLILPVTILFAVFPGLFVLQLGF
ncbi:MAG: type II secretion system F family protein [Cryobacterium sp.]|nr:type II secretion system F family protein [Cryobacterium sp.]